MLKKYRNLHVNGGDIGKIQNRIVDIGGRMKKIIKRIVGLALSIILICSMKIINVSATSTEPQTNVIDNEETRIYISDMIKKREIRDPDFEDYTPVESLLEGNYMSLEKPNFKKGQTYWIATYEDLACLLYCMIADIYVIDSPTWNIDFTGVKICLENDIDAQGQCVLIDSYKGFNGTFDGKGHTIKNWVSKDGEYFLFDAVNKKGIVKNLNLTGVSKDDKIRKLFDMNVRGGIARQNLGTIRNCTVKVDYINKKASNSHFYIGGVVGLNLKTGKISNCVFKGSISTKKGKPVSYVHSGGICSFNSGVIEKCINRGTIRGQYKTGGISSDNGDSSYRKGDKIPTSKIKGCANLGNISGVGAVGGIVGYMDPGYIVYDCYNIGSVTSSAKGTYYLFYQGNAGGIAGVIVSSCRIENCYNVGNIKGYYQGGIISTELKQTYIYTDKKPENMPVQTIKNCMSSTGCFNGSSNKTSKIINVKKAKKSMVKKKITEIQKKYKFET